MDEKGLGVRLQNARRKAGLTQQQLCQQSGLSYSTLAKIERGAIKSPSIFTIQQIAEALNTSVDVLIGGQPTGPVKKRSKSGICFVYFDVNGCLVRFFHRAFTQIAAETGVSSDIVESVFWHNNDAVCRGDITIDEFNRILSKAFEVHDFKWPPYYLNAVDSIKETAEVLNWAAQHYRIGLLTNIMPGLLEEMRLKSIIPELPYDSIIDSSQVKAIKPEATIYQIAAKKAGCQPNEILLIDDSRTNLMAAEKQDWRVLWFDDYQPAESAARIRQALEF